MSCVAWSNQTPIGTASNFLQCKWVSCRKSYWQGCDLGWYKDMGAPCFPQPNLWPARCASMSWTALKKFVVLSAQELRIGIKPSFHCGRKAWQVLPVLRLRRLLCLFRLALSCRLRRLARWCEMAQMVSTATQPRYATARFHSNQPETFPLSAGVSRPYLPSVPNKATETVIFCFGKMFARAAAAAGGSSRQAAAAAGGSSRQAAAGKQQQARSSRQAAAGKQQQAAAAAAGGSSSSRRKQQQQEAAAAAAGGGSSSSRRKQQQQQEEAAAAGGSSSSRKQQQQEEEAAAAAGGSSSSSRKQQQQQKEAAAVGGSSSSRQAAAGSSRQQHNAAAAGGGSSNSSRRKQQQQEDAAAGKQQQQQETAEGKQQQASSRQAAGKQQASSNQRLPPWKNDQTYFLKINAIKKMNFFQPHGPKTMKSFNY